MTKMRQTLLKSFPEVNFLELVDNLDPKNLYEPLFKGMYEDTVKVNDKERTFITYIPQDAIQGNNSIFIAVPSRVDTKSFLENSGWIQIAEKYNQYLFAFEPEDGYWDTGNSDYEIDYIGKAFNYITGIRPYYNMLLGNFYFVGYGAGGTLLQQYIMANPKLCAGLAVFDGNDISEKYIKITGTKYSDDPLIPQSKVKVPVWIISENFDESAQRVIDYWLNANDSTLEGLKNDYADVFMQSPIAARRLDNDQNVSRVQVSIGKFEYEDASFNEIVWKDFLSKTCRYSSGIYNNALRPYVSFEELGIERCETNVDGYTRHWYEYIPKSVKTNPDKKVPLLVAMHGIGQTGAIFVSYTEWYKVAEEREFIVVFPTGSPLTISPGNTPKPGWKNCLLDKKSIYSAINKIDDAKFIRELVKIIKDKYVIDDSRVYLTGQSNGCMMTNYMAITSTYIFAAAAGTSGPLLGISNPEAELPHSDYENYEIPVWMIFGENDLFGGGSLKNNPDAKCTVDYWVKRNKAGYFDKPLTYKCGIFNHQVWTNSIGVPMVRYTITKGRQHNCAAAETWLLWDEFLCQFSRNVNGTIEYMSDNDVMR